MRRPRTPVPSPGTTEPRTDVTDPSLPPARGSHRAVSRRARRHVRGASTGVVPLAIGIVLLLVMGLTPTPYAIKQPGPVFNALGDVTLKEGEPPVPVLTVDGAASYDTGAGRLNVMTVNVAGSPRTQPGWFESLIAYLTPSSDVVPIEVYYPPGQSLEDRTAANQQLMQSSQSDAIAAALRHEGYTVGVAIIVREVRADGASVGLLEPGDKFLRIDGETVTSAEQVTAAVNATEGQRPLAIEVERGGAVVAVSVMPKVETVNGTTRPLLGITSGGAYDFPVDITVQLGDVGGPSAGLVFALAIVDKLTPGEMTGGLNVAGTGTMSSDGQVGPIGGIRQKLTAAAAQGAVAFLAPVDNCAEAVDGGVPGGLPVYAVDTLDTGERVVETLGAGGDAAGLRTCQDVVAGA